MPIYEYRCSSCGHELESLQKFSDAPLRTCPACSKDALVKLMSAAGFQLKGSGWYATDFKSSGSRPPAKADGGDGKPGVAKTDAKPDAAAKSETKSETAAPAATPPASTGPGPAAS